MHLCSRRRLARFELDCAPAGGSSLRSFGGGVQRSACRRSRRSISRAVLDAATTQSQARLSVELFARAFELARTQPGGSAIAASACRGLAEAVRIERDRPWFGILAALTDPRGAEPGWLRKPAPASVDSYPYRIAAVLGSVRAGDGLVARQQLNKPDLRQAIEAIEPMLRRSGVSGGIASLERDAKLWPCPTCSNEGIVRRLGTSPPEYKACPNCLGKPGPRLSPAELTAQLRFESWLLQGLQRSWAAQLTADDGSPLIDPDPAAVCSRVGVDAARMYWRNGKFVRHAAGSDGAPASPASEEATPAKPTVPADSSNTSGN